MTRLVAFVGRSTLAQRCIDHLLAKGINIHALVVDGYFHSHAAGARATSPSNPTATSSMSMLSPPASLQVARADRVPPWYAHARKTTVGKQVIVIGANDAPAMRNLQDTPLTHLISVCFPRRITPSHRQLASKGAFNLHPSRLPRYRGPAPVFWQLRHGEREIGLTVHALSEQIDAGPIVWQHNIACEIAMDNDEIVQRCASIGADALIEVIATDTPATVAQDETQATYHRWPQPADFELNPAWSIDHARRFIQGTLHWQYHYSHPDIERRLPILRLASSSDEPTLATSVITQMAPGSCRLRFMNGVIDVQLARHDRVSTEGSAG